MILTLLLLTLFTWVYYLAMCTLKRANDAGKLPKSIKPVAYLLLGLFLAVDCFFNLTVGTLSYLQLPGEFLFTTRCEINMRRNDWRAKVAKWWCSVMLDPFDPSGKHCR